MKRLIIIAFLTLSLSLGSVFANNNDAESKENDGQMPLPPFNEIFYIVDTIYIENPKVIWWEGNAIVVDSVDIPAHISDFKAFLRSTNFYFIVPYIRFLSIKLQHSRFMELLWYINKYDYVETILTERESKDNYTICDIHTRNGNRIHYFNLALVNLRWLNLCQVYEVLDGKEKPFEADYELNI